MFELLDECACPLPIGEAAQHLVYRFVGVFFQKKSYHMRRNKQFFLEKMQAAAAANCHIRKETKILQCICADCLCDLRSLEALFNTDMHDNKKS